MDEIRIKLAADTERFRDRLGDVVAAFTEFSAALAFTSLPTAERWVAGLPRRHYADPELTTPAGTEAER